MNEEKLTFSKLMGMAQYKQYVVALPAIPYKLLEKFLGTVYKEKIPWGIYFDTISGYGVMLFMRLFDEMKITSLVQLKRLQQCIDENLYEFVVHSNQMTPSIPLYKMTKILKEFKKRNMSIKQQNEFFNLLIDAYDHIPNRVLVKDEDIETVFKIWDEQEKRDGIV